MACKPPRLCSLIAGMMAMGLLVSFPLDVRASVITILNADAPGEGLNDATPAAPVGGNSGTTLGEQRLIVMQRAADIWAAKISSPVDIIVESNFDPLDCTASQGVLGAASAFTFFRNFTGSPFADTWYPVALANALAGRDLDPGEPDIVATFNSDLGSPGCLSSRSWYYGLDHNPPSGQFDFFDIVLHEIAHGLGFLTLVDLQSGSKANGFDDIYMRNLEDHSTGKRFPEMSNNERFEAMKSEGDLHWVGSNVVAQSGFLVAGRSPEGHVEMYAPNPIETGSSVSHFSVTLFPNELMEPFATPTSDRRLTEALFLDLGWVTQDNAPNIIAFNTEFIAEECLPANQVADPGEVVTLQLNLRNTGTGLTENLVGTLLATPEIQPVSPPASYGTVPAGGAVQGQPFSFAINAPCGSQVNLDVQLQDGTNDLGIISFPIRVGFFPTTIQSFDNASPIRIPASGKSGPAGPYPSSITVSGVTSTVSRVSVTLHDLSHDFPDNIDITLLGPNGEAILLMSDAGGFNNPEGVTLTLDDEATESLPDADVLTTGTFKPTNYGTGDSFPAPAPFTPTDTELAVYAGADPNGTWSLFILDDSNPNSGQLAGGWTLHIHAELPPICCDASEFSADLEVSAGSFTSPINAGATVSIPVTVANDGPDTAISVILTSTLSGEGTYLPVSTSQGSCVVAGDTVTCQLGNLDPQQTALVRLFISTGSTGSYTNALSVTALSTDPDSTNDSLSVSGDINSPPQLSNTPDQTIAEDAGATTINFLASDLETAPNDLLITVNTSNTNLFPIANLILSGTGTNRWLQFTPAPDAFGIAAITVTVDDGLTRITDLFLVTVTPENDPPSLVAIADRTLHVGQTLLITNTATDVDSSELTFQLDAGPPGMSLDSQSGILTWTPAPEQNQTTNLVLFSVLDDGLPPLSDSESFVVIVQSAPAIDSIAIDEGTVTITWQAIPGQTYRVQATEDVTTAIWSDLPGNVTAATATATFSEPIQARRFYRVTVP